MGEEEDTRGGVSAQKRDIVSRPHDFVCVVGSSGDSVSLFAIVHQAAVVGKSVSDEATYAS